MVAPIADEGAEKRADLFIVKTVTIYVYPVFPGATRLSNAI
jgi:hypothetical protein